MDPTIEQQLEKIHVQPLSSKEEQLVWGRIKTALPKTPLPSPYSPSIFFSSQKAVVFAALFLVILGTVSAADSSNPQSALFPLDVAVERVESTLNPSSRAKHARERVEEFELTFAKESGDTSEEVVDGVRMQKDDAALAPSVTNEAAFEMTAFSVVNDSAETQAALSSEMKEAIDITRRELTRIMAKATLRGDTETLQKIQMIIDEFEATVARLR